MGLKSKRFAEDDVLEQCLAGTHVMETGEQGEAVHKVQLALIELGYDLTEFGPDGKFGDEMGSAVSAFQSDHDLNPPDERIGPKTMGALDDSFADEDPDVVDEVPDIDTLMSGTIAVALKTAQLLLNGVAIGLPTSELIAVAGGYQQSFENAVIYWHPSTGVAVLRGDVAARYAETGGPGGYLGFPTGDQTAEGSGDYATFAFQGSGIFARADLGTFEVHGLIGERYLQSGGAGGYLGYPTTDETASGAGAFNRFEFQGSGILWHPTLGVHEVHGAIGEYYWNTMGGPGGSFAYPISDEYTPPNTSDRAVDFEGGTLYWSPDFGVTEFPVAAPTPQTFGEWLTIVPDAPSGAGKNAALTEIPVPAPIGERADITLVYTDPTAAAGAPSEDASVVNACQAIEAVRDLVGIAPGLHNVAVRAQGNGSDYIIRGYQFTSKPVPLSTTVTADEAVRITRATLPEGITPDQFLQAALDVWHDLSGHEGDPAAINAYDSVNVTWGGGFAAAGQLQSLVLTLFARSPDARNVFLQAGMSVESVDRVPTFVAIDTAKRWRLYGEDAERYIRTDRRLLTVLINVALGHVPASLLPGDPNRANEQLRQTTLDAQFVTLLRNAGRLPGWSVLPQWTRERRAGVAHNLHFGCLGGSNWAPYERSAGDPVEIVRAMAWAYKCSAQSLLASSAARFEGAFAHKAFKDAAASFPTAAPGDDGLARYIRAGGVKRRVDKPQ